MNNLENVLAHMQLTEKKMARIPSLKWKARTKELSEWCKDLKNVIDRKYTLENDIKMENRKC